MLDPLQGGGRTHRDFCVTNQKVEAIKKPFCLLPSASLRLLLAEHQRSRGFNRIEDFLVQLER